MSGPIHTIQTSWVFDAACATKKWSSKMIAVTIGQYTSNRYNARVHRQRCKKCGYLGCPELNKSHAERVAYRLKKWSGVEANSWNFDTGQSINGHKLILPI